MEYGFVKVRAVSPDLKVADTAYNGEAIKKELILAGKDGVQLLVFPELSLCGYTCGDLFLQRTLLNGCLNELSALLEVSRAVKTLAFVGLPFALGGKLYNCAAAICGGRLLALIPKRNLPNYGEFYEKRYFSEGVQTAREVTVCGQKTLFGSEIILRDETLSAFTVGCELCEDLWAAQSPSCRHAAAGANIIVNLSASSETAGKAEYRKLLVRAQSAKCACGYLYADAGTGESTSESVFAGHNLIAENGTILAESKPFACGRADGEIDVQMLEGERRRLNALPLTEGYTEALFRTEQSPCVLTRTVERFPFLPNGEEKEARTELILNMQAHALAKRLSHTGAKRAVLGISGGLDSALAFLVTVRAFDLLKRDRKQILAVTMPGFGTTGKTKNNSLALMQAMGAEGRTIDIVPAVLRHFEDIGHDKTVYDAAYENAQARMRTMILMDLANETGGIVVGTGDLSEGALGWCTYNGDHMSMYSVNASVPKTLVKALVGYEAARIGGTAGETLCGILSTEISPELLPSEGEKIAQKTESLIGPYELHDFYLYHCVRHAFSPKKILFLAEQAFGKSYSRAELKKWLTLFYRRFFSQQFKRSCSPDGVKVGEVSLSPRSDWRMPSDAAGKLWLEEVENL